MQRRCRGVTITELLTVVSVLAILTSFIGPFTITVKHAALGRACGNNLRQVYVGLQVVANSNYAKLPACFDVNGTGTPMEYKNYAVNEGSWWYWKAYRLMQTTGAALDDPNVMRCRVVGCTYRAAESGLCTTHTTVSLVPDDRVSAVAMCLRCPGTSDPYNQGRVSASYSKASGVDKDRVFDDCFGYNNFGFTYNIGDASKENKPAMVNPDTLRWGAIGNSYYYRATGTNWGSIIGSPKHIRKTQGVAPNVTYVSPAQCVCGYKVGGSFVWPCRYARIGEFSEVPEAARTMLMMDYIKADVAPNLLNDGLWAFRFRHGGRANVMFVDGHVNMYNRPEFLTDWAEPDHGSWIAADSGTARGAIDPNTRRGRIHWAVLRP